VIAIEARSRGRRLGRYLRVVAAGALVCGCSSTVAGHAVSTGAKSSGHASSGAASASNSAAPRSFAELEALLITSVPAGFSVQPDAFGDTGPSDLAKAIRDDGEPGAARVLRRDGFRRGYQRLWMSPARKQIIVFIYQFAAPTGAADYYHRGIRVVRSTAPASLIRFKIPGLPTARSIGFTAHTRHLTAAFASAYAGPLFMQVVCNASSSAGLRARVTSLAREQFNRL
jgi:hypothetical protein